VVAWVLGSFWYRPVEMPSDSAPFDARAFEARFPDFDADRSGAMIRQALGEIGQHEKRVAALLPAPTRPLTYPPTLLDIREEMERVVREGTDEGEASSLAKALRWTAPGGLGQGDIPRGQAWQGIAPRYTVLIPIVGSSRFVTPNTLVAIPADGPANGDLPAPVERARRLWVARYTNVLAQGGLAADATALGSLATALALNADHPTAKSTAQSYRTQLARVIDVGWPAGDPELGRWLDHWCSDSLFEPDWLLHLRAGSRMPLGIVENTPRLTPRTELRSLEPTRFAAQLLTARAIQLQARGEHARALDELLLVLRLARQQCNLSLPVCYSAGLRAEQTALRGLDRWLGHHPKRPDLLRKALNELARHEQELCPWADSIRAEYLMMSNELRVPSAWIPQALDPHYDKTQIHVDPLAEAISFALTIPWEASRARAILDAYYAGRLEGAAIPYRAFVERFAATERSANPRRGLAARWGPASARFYLRWAGWVTPAEGPLARLTPEQMADFLSRSWVHDAVFSFGAAGVMDTTLRQLATCDLRATRIRLALTLYHLEQGHPVEQLKDLVPNYLSNLPADPFGDGPFKFIPAAKVPAKFMKERLGLGRMGLWAMGSSGYQPMAPIPPRTGVVYSVGPDLFDDGGDGHVGLTGLRFDERYGQRGLEYVKLGDVVYLVPEP
jgi:hypothetical protein